MKKTSDASRGLWMGTGALCVLSLGVILVVGSCKKEEAVVVRGATAVQPAAVPVPPAVPVATAPAPGQIDLSQILEAFQRHANGRVLAPFEAEINARRLYAPGHYVKVRRINKGATVVGFIDVNNDNLYTRRIDKLVFKIEIEKRAGNVYLIAGLYDGAGWHYWRSPVVGGLLTYWMVSSMLRSHFAYYRGYRTYGYVYAPRPIIVPVYRAGYFPRPAHRPRPVTYSRGGWAGRGSSGSRFGGK